MDIPPVEKSWAGGRPLIAALPIQNPIYMYNTLKWEDQHPPMGVPVPENELKMREGPHIGENHEQNRIDDIVEQSRFAPVHALWQGQVGHGA
jgi:hypothetical protein